MKTGDFYYDLPKELIAQTPLADRSASRLMVMERGGGLRHRVFSEITDYLNPGDCLVINDTKVIPARLTGFNEKTGGKAELLLLKRLDANRWEALTKPGKKVGQRLVFGEGLLRAEIEKVNGDGNRTVRFEYGGVFEELLDRLGKAPLPPYIKEELDERGRYQTVYARRDGSAAAPTAGLHFTEELLSAIAAKGVNIARLTLHVGLGTFRPVKTDEIAEHVMHSEYYQIPEEQCTLINSAKRRGGRVIAVGTTSCRTLETCAGGDGLLRRGEGWTDIFIYPGYKFKIVDAIITNFHLPESTLIMLISAFAGRERVLEAYAEAVREEYRFFSFGDAMMIL